MLDPADRDDFRTLAHRVLDDALDGFARVADGPAWRPVPDDVKAELAEPVPRVPAGFDAAYAEFAKNIAPFENGTRDFSAGFTATARRRACSPRCCRPRSTPTSADANTARSMSSGR
jgi:hypothetical protein